MGANSKSDLNKIIDVIEDMVKSNQDILKLLSSDNAKTDIYNLPDYTSPKKIQDIVDEKMFNYKKEFDNNTMCCYMVMSYGRKLYHQTKNIYFDGNTFYFYILCHTDIIDNDLSGNRVNEIEHAIVQMFNGRILPNYGVRCKVVNSGEIQVKSTKYEGRVVAMEFVSESTGGVNPW